MTVSGTPRDSPRSSGSNLQMQDDCETSATHTLIAVCQWLDETTRRCEEQQERILKLMNSLSIGIDDKLGTALDQMTDALNTTRAILSELQRPQRYLQLGEDTHTWEKGKEREERPQAQACPTSQKNMNFGEDSLVEQLAKEPLNMAGDLKKMPRKYTSPQERKRKRPRGTAWK